MGQNQRIMNKELGRTIKLFLLWCLLYVATAIIGLILWRVFKNIEFFNWTIVLGYILIIILFFGKGYVKLSFGRIEKPTIWPAVGVSVLIAVAQLFVLFSVLTLLDVAAPPLLGSPAFLSENEGFPAQAIAACLE